MLINDILQAHQDKTNHKSPLIIVNSTSNGADSSKKLIGDFLLGKTLGQGTFGKVKIGTHIITGEKVAVKILEKVKILDNADKNRVDREITILKTLMHHNIIQIYSVIETPTTIFLIMEYANGGELFNYIVLRRHLTELEACKFFQQIIDAVEYLHRIGVVHRDLKPENLLLDHNKDIKLVDFGLSNVYSKGELLKTPCGSPCYAAPEMINGRRYDGLKVDIWSSGIILFAMLCGYLPFDDKNDVVLYKKITEGKLRFPGHLSDNAKSLIRKILTTDPVKRGTIEQIRTHPWFMLAHHVKNEGLVINHHIIPVDCKILDFMAGYGYSKEEIKDLLQSNRHNKITTIYYLLIKKNYRMGISSVSDITSWEFMKYIQNPENISPGMIKTSLSQRSITWGLPLPNVKDNDRIKTETNYDNLAVTSENMQTEICDVNTEENRLYTEQGIGTIEEKEKDNDEHNSSSNFQDSDGSNGKIDKNNYGNFFKTDIDIQQDTEYSNRKNETEHQPIVNMYGLEHFKKIPNMNTINYSMKNKLLEQYNKYVKKRPRKDTKGDFHKGFIDTSTSYEKNSEMKHKTYTVEDEKDTKEYQFQFQFQFLPQLKKSKIPKYKGIIQLTQQGRPQTNSPQGKDQIVRSGLVTVGLNKKKKNMIKKISKNNSNRSCPEIQEGSIPRGIFVIKEDEEYKKSSEIKKVINYKAFKIPKGDLTQITSENNKTRTERISASVISHSYKINKNIFNTSPKIKHIRCISEPNNTQRNINYFKIGKPELPFKKIFNKQITKGSYHFSPYKKGKHNNYSNLIKLNPHSQQDSSYTLNSINSKQPTNVKKFSHKFNHHIKPPIVNLKKLNIFSPNLSATCSNKKKSQVQKSSSLSAFSGRKSSSTFNSTSNDKKPSHKTFDGEIVLHKGPVDILCSTVKPPLSVWDNLLHAVQRCKVTWKESAVR